ncbi:VOC family protein [Methylovirgula sp. 4M-Z18]|uniref:VOC family protein n=1 Tax=Methylovirgula sp. 4M-Z18 TaxID=2293567 RepID=UPI000E2EBB74|nr:VOC family protein [Methylovirgula sp. 4M-Z18]RFB79238.1 glyoxalase [Methylovirgula sp. 4M-Z18]
MAPPVTALLETSLYAADMAVTARFYAEVLGLRLLLTSPRLTAFDAGRGTVLLVFQKGATEEDGVTDRGTIPGHDGTGRLHLALAIPPESLEAWRAQLAAHEVTITGEFHWPRGGTSLYFSDPDGHVVELATPGLWEVY